MVRDLIEGNIVTTTNSDSDGKIERRLLYIKSLRLFLVLGYAALIFGFLAYFIYYQDPNMILLSMYGTAASIFAMAIVGLLWVTNETPSISADREWQFQFLSIVGLLLAGTAFMFLGTLLIAVPYAIVIYLYVGRLIRGT